MPALQEQSSATMQSNPVAAIYTLKTQNESKSTSDIVQTAEKNHNLPESL